MSSTSTAVDGKESTKATISTSQRKRAKAGYTDTAGRVQRQTKSTVRKLKTGRLSQLMSIPMDVLMEIFGHLHPLDLLHLARTTKAFRRVLMHRSSLFVWKAALLTVPGLPDCPPELSEPQWANLAFDAHCSICLRPNIRNVDWVLRVRLCTECTKQHITDWHELTGEGYCRDMMSAVPHRYGKRGDREFLRDEYRKVFTQCYEIENADARQTFFEERQQLVKRIKEHAKLCVAWASSQASFRSGELKCLKSSRHQAIVDKLAALGWGDEIDKIPPRDALKTHKLVKVPQLLTDRIWANISKTMIEYMEEMKANRLARELAQLRAQRQPDSIKLLRRYKTERAPFTDVMPEQLDFYAFGPIKEIVDQPRDINVNSESFMHLMPELDGVVQEWRSMILTQFMNEVKGVVKRFDALDDNPLDLDHLSDELQHIQLACTVFSCQSCNQIWGYGDMMPRTRPLWFPRVLGHRCLTKQRWFTIDNDSETVQIYSYHRQRWSCDFMIEVDEAASQAAAVIIEACEMDPSITTVDEMDQLDARLICLACLELNANDPSRKIGLDWRSAVKHQRDYHPSHQGDWRMLSVTTAELARVEESVHAIIRPIGVVRAHRRVWLCFHCLDGDHDQSWMTLEDVQHHLRLRHSVEDARVNQDYVKDYAALELYETCI